MGAFLYNAFYCFKYVHEIKCIHVTNGIFALHVIFGSQTVDSHVMILVTGHFLHHGGIFAQRTNDVGVEGGTVKVTGLVLFQQI